MLGYSVANYLSRFQISTPLWGEKLIPLIDYTLSNSYVDKDLLSSPFYQLINKYTNTTELPLEGLKKYVEEMGYGYILDFFNPDEEAAQRLVSFLIVIHFLKGSRKGLELILSIMGIGGRIVEWYETIPLGVCNTFTLLVDSNTLTDNNNPETYTNFSKFVKSYVYPEVNFTIIYNARINYVIYSDLQGTMKIKYPCYIDATYLETTADRVIDINLTDDIRNNSWSLVNCYQDAYDRVVPDSLYAWGNINSLVWGDSGTPFGYYDIWGEKCIAYSYVESPVVDMAEELSTQININYTKTIIHNSSYIIIKWRTSKDNITWSDYAEYSSSIKFLRYYQIKVEFVCAQNRLAIIS